MPVEVVVDCDPGVDDGLALLALGGLAGEGTVRVRCVTAVAGNGPVQETARNAAYVVERSPLRGTPVLAGLTGPPVPRQAGPGRPHGPDGLAGLVPPGGPPRPPATAVEALAAALADGTTVLALGPLTNVAAALERAGGAAGPGARVVAMGGRLDGPPEFNVAYDPTAAEAVLSSGLPVTLVPIDVTGSVRFDGDDAAALRRDAADGLAAGLLAWTVATGPSPAHDAVAAVALTDPALVTTARGAMRTVEVVVACDTAAARRRLLDLWSPAR